MQSGVISNELNRLHAISEAISDPPDRLLAMHEGVTVAEIMSAVVEISLDKVAIGQPMTVRSVIDGGAPEWAGWLREIGFHPGERVVLMARGFPGGDPLMIRIGMSTFALRVAEAACVRVVAATAVRQP